MKTDGNTSTKRGRKQKEYVQGIKAVDQSLENLHTHTHTHMKKHWERQAKNSSQRKKHHWQQKPAIIQSAEMLTSFCSRNTAVTKELSYLIQLQLAFMAAGPEKLCRSPPFRAIIILPCPSMVTDHPSRHLTSCPTPCDDSSIPSNVILIRFSMQRREGFSSSQRKS